MKTYYEEVKAWLDGPDDGRIPSEAFGGFVHEHEKLLKLQEELDHAIRHIREYVAATKCTCVPLKWQCQHCVFQFDLNHIDARKA